MHLKTEQLLRFLCLCFKFIRFTLEHEHCKAVTLNIYAYADRPVHHSRLIHRYCFIIMDVFVWNKLLIIIMLFFLSLSWCNISSKAVESFKWNAITLQQTQRFTGASTEINVDHLHQLTCKTIMSSFHKINVLSKQLFCDRFSDKVIPKVNVLRSPNFSFLWSVSLVSLAGLLSLHLLLCVSHYVLFQWDLSYITAVTTHIWHPPVQSPRCFLQICFSILQGWICQNIN